MSNEEDTVIHKGHRERHSGRKAEKKKSKKEKNQVGLPDKQKNPKAFTFNSAIRAERRFRRKQDIDTKKTHIPLIDRTPLEPPPILVAIVGPPKVGKTLLIQCLIKNFVKQPMTNIKGPVTVVSGKKRRITFMECNNDINCMIDIAKVADLVLLLIDASFGFEMEIFEFLNICQVHGMPRIMGILNHLDKFSNAKQMRKTKKMLKHRFWTEVYAGAKLFYLSGLIHDQYLKNEIKNLSRFISVIKLRPLTWKTTHPYLLVDRVEDLTSPETIRQNPKTDRNVCLYGYVRGISLIKQSYVHIPGCGDFRIKDVSFLPDPCPLPEQLKKRALIEKERLIYAPFSGVGGIVYDKDAVYVELGGSHSHSLQHKKADDGMISNLIDIQNTLDEKLMTSELKLFSEAEPIKSKDVDEMFGGRFNQKNVFVEGRVRRKVIFNDNRDQNDMEDEKNECDEGEDESIENDTEGTEDEDENDEGDEERDGENEILKKKRQNGREGEKIISEHLKTGNNDEGGKDEDDKVGEDVGQKEGQNDVLKNEKKRKISISEEIITTQTKKLKNDDENDLEYELAQLRASNMGANNKKQKENEKTALVYRKLAKDVDKEVQNKISQALDRFETIRSRTSKKISDKNDLNSDESDDDEQEDDDESFDELSDSDFENNAEENVDENLENNIISASAENDNDNEKVEDGLKWKANLSQKAKEAFLNRRLQNNVNLMKLVYGVSESSKQFSAINEEENTEEKNDCDDKVGGIFHVISEKQREKQKLREIKNQEESVFFITEIPRNWSSEENKLLIINRFVTGKWEESEDAEKLIKLDDLSENEEIFGDFEDLETGEKVETRKKNESAPKEISRDEMNEKQKLLEKKRKLKQQFDTEYDNAENKTYYDDLKQEVENQAQLNRSEFEGLDDELRVQLEGFRPGMYVRIEFESVPCELIANLDPSYPLIIGGLIHGEESIGFVQGRIKKHRWYPKILKNRDPLILSVGWRRFQTLPIFSKLEDNMRHRMLKYTPEHVACMAHFWGPITPQGTGVLAIQDVAHRTSGFRIAATGTIVELDKSTRVVKKLKLTGVPLKIFKKTAFIKDMFNSSLEVAKFEGAKIKTVSGIRGQIKKAITKPEGCFRATFEDKIQLSDIVFCRTWYKIDVPKFYNPVNSLLLPISKKSQWSGMKTVGQLKRERGIKAEPNPDSLYTPIERPTKIFKPLVIPRKLQKELPYRDKPKMLPKKYDDFNEKIEDIKKNIVVVRDKKEENVAKLMKMIRVAYQNKQMKMKEAMHKRMSEHQKKMEAEEMRKLKRQKEMKKQIHRTLSKMDAKEKKGVKGKSQ